MAKIVLIDDDASLLDVLSLSFEDAGHTVFRAQDGLAGMELIQSQGVDLVVSDVNMPGIDGFSLCRKLRAAQNGVPVILLTSRDNEIDEALGLELGADDYVAKPFSTRVLLARVQALLRRQHARASGKRGSNESATGGKTRTVVGPLELDAERIEVRYRGADVTVTVTEFRMLEVLSARPGVVFSRDRLLELVRGDDSVVAARIIDTYIRRLRRKLEAVDPNFDEIDTVVGAGYRWRGRAD